MNSITGTSHPVTVFFTMSSMSAPSGIGLSAVGQTSTADCGGVGWGSKHSASISGCRKPRIDETGDNEQQCAGPRDDCAEAPDSLLFPRGSRAGCPHRRQDALPLPRVQISVLLLLLALLACNVL